MSLSHVPCAFDAKSIPVFRRHHEVNLSRYDAAETSLADLSHKESNKLRERVANTKCKKKRPEQRKETNGFMQPTQV